MASGREELKGEGRRYCLASRVLVTYPEEVLIAKVDKKNASK